MARHTADDTRRQLINAGLQLLFERGAAVGVQDVRLQDVLRLTGTSTGAAYRIWADQLDYQKDLAVAAMKVHAKTPAAEAKALLDRMSVMDVDLDEFIRVGCEGQMDLLERFRTHPIDPEAEVYITVLAVRTTAAAWPDLAVASAERHRTSVARFVELYQRTLDVFGYRMRTPYTVQDFGEAMAALSEGFAIRAAEGLELPALVIEDAHEGPSGRWTLFGIAVRALVREFTLPLTPSSTP